MVKVGAGLLGAWRVPGALFEVHSSSRLALTVKSSGGATMLKVLALGLKEKSRIVTDSFLSFSLRKGSRIPGIEALVSLSRVPPASFYPLASSHGVGGCAVWTALGWRLAARQRLL